MKPKEKAVKAFQEYIRIRDAYKTTGEADALRCFTCGRWCRLDGSAHAGHYLPRRTNASLFDERNCHGQCIECNIDKYGNPEAYEDRMLAEYGQDVIDELRANDCISVRYTDSDYDDIARKYLKMIQQLHEYGRLSCKPR